MSGNSTDEFAIQFEYDPEFEQLIRDGEMPDCRIKIRADEKYLLGDEDRYVESIMTGLTLVDMLKTAEEAISGTARSFELLDSGTYVVVEPRGEDTVAVTKCFSPDEVEDPNERLFDPLVVPRDAVVSEIVRVAEQWRDDALAVDPDIASVDWFEDLQTAIGDVKVTYRSSQTS